MIKAYRTHFVVIVLYTLLALIFTWPVAARLSTHIPGEATWAFDESTFIWNMWWFKHSLLALQQHPLFSTYIFYPLGINLTTYTFNLFNAAFGLPLQLALSLPLANNLTLLFSYISAAYGMFLLALYVLYQAGAPDAPASRAVETRPPLANYLAAFIAGTVFAFSASRMMYVALGHYNFVTIQWFPFYTLFLLKTLRRATAKNIWLTGLFAAFCLYAELTYSVFLLFLTLIILTGFFLTNRPANKTSLLKPLLALAVAAGVAFILTTPFTLVVLPDFLDPAYTESGWGEGLKLSADLAGLVTLTPLHPFSGGAWQTELRAVIEGTSRFNDANTLFLGYGVLAFALLGFALHRKQSRIWLWSAIIFTILSLGPLLTINGQNRFDLDGLEVTFPLPFALLHYIPLINANRVPNRFGIPLTMSLAVLVAYAAARLLSGSRKQGAGSREQEAGSREQEAGSRKQGAGSGKQEAGSRKQEAGSGKREAGVMSQTTRNTQYAIRNTQYAIRNTQYAIRILLTIALIIILMFDQYSVPLSMTDARIPDVYDQIGAEPDDFTLMQLPLGWRNSYGTLGAERTQLQYFQAAHQRPMLGGNTSRNPAFKFDYYANIPLFYALTEAELYRTVEETTRRQAQAQAAELMTLYNIKYLVTHDPIPGRLPYLDTAAATQNLALKLIPHHPEPVYQAPGVQAFAVEQAPIPNPLTIDFGQQRSAPYRGEGWAGNEEIFAATANWVTATRALVFFPVRGDGDRRLAIQIAPFSYPGMSSQIVTLSLNSRALSDSFSLGEGWQSIETTLPETMLVQGLNRLTLHFAHTAQPRRVLPTDAAIGDTGVETPVDVEVNSSYDFAFITVGFENEAVDASAHRRGLNLTVVAPQSGEVMAVKGFDTAANAFEAAALNEFIETIPAGRLVIVAARGAEATTFLDAASLTALASVGLSTENLAPPFAAIGVKGAPPGAALQTGAGDGGTAYLRLGAPPDTRHLAAAVDKIVIARSNE